MTGTGCEAIKDLLADVAAGKLSQDEVDPTLWSVPVASGSDSFEL